MLPGINDIVGLTTTIVSTLKNHYDVMKENKSEAEYMVQRIQTIEGIIGGLDATKKIARIDIVDNALSTTKEILLAIHKLLTENKDKKSLKKWLKEFFHAPAYKKKLKEIKIKLNEAIIQLSFAVNVTGLSKMIAIETHIVALKECSPSFSTDLNNNTHDEPSSILLNEIEKLQANTGQANEALVELSRDVNKVEALLNCYRDKLGETLDFLVQLTQSARELKDGQQQIRQEIKHGVEEIGQRLSQHHQENKTHLNNFDGKFNQITNRQELIVENQQALIQAQKEFSVAHRQTDQLLGKVDQQQGAMTRTQQEQGTHIVQLSRKMDDLLNKQANFQQTQTNISDAAQKIDTTLNEVYQYQQTLLKEQQYLVNQTQVDKEKFDLIIKSQQQSQELGNAIYSMGQQNFQQLNQLTSQGAILEKLTTHFEQIRLNNNVVSLPAPINSVNLIDSELLFPGVTIAKNTSTEICYGIYRDHNVIIKTYAKVNLSRYEEICKYEINIYQKLRAKGFRGLVEFFGISYDQMTNKLQVITKADKQGHGFLLDALGVLQKQEKSEAIPFIKVAMALQIVTTLRKIYSEESNSFLLYGLSHYSIQVNKKWEAKLTNFVADKIEKGIMQDLPILSAENNRFIAPEILSRQQNYITEKSQIYTIGLLLFTIFSGHLPFDKYDDKQVIGQIVGNALPEGIEELSTGVKRLIVSCLNSEPEKRPTHDQIYVALTCLQHNQTGNNYADAKDYANAVVQYDKAAKLGSAAAMENLGDIYSNTLIEGKSDFRKAFKYYQDAAMAFAADENVSGLEKLQEKIANFSNQMEKIFNYAMQMLPRLDKQASKQKTKIPEEMTNNITLLINKASNAYSGFSPTQKETFKLGFQQLESFQKKYCPVSEPVETSQLRYNRGW